MSETRERELVKRVATAMMAVSRPNANPDDLTPAPRGQLGYVPKWTLYEHMARAAIEALSTSTQVDAMRDALEEARATLKPFADNWDEVQMWADFEGVDRREICLANSIILDEWERCKNALAKIDAALSAQAKTTSP